MPWRREAMKGVVSCDKPRGAAKQALIRGFPNGATWQGKPLSSCTEHIGAGGEPGEVKHLSTRRKRKQKRFPK